MEKMLKFRLLHTLEVKKQGRRNMSMVHINLTTWRLKPRLFINADGSTIAAHEVIDNLGKLKKLSFSIKVSKSSFSFWPDCLCFCS